MRAEGGASGNPEIGRPGGGTTRGFLFADLRGYTAFIEAHGADAAASLLERYRTIVRAAVARYDGAEIRTEGDGFYVVFPSVSGALRCGLEIVGAAEQASEPSTYAIRVGVGIHAGETVETPEGYVGQAINIAARLCSIAAPGEVLVSDTVRSLTQGVLGVRFTARGRRRLKGVAEPVAVFAVKTMDAAQVSMLASRRPYMRLLLAAAAVAGSVAVIGAIALATRPASLPPSTWKIGLSLPLGGDRGAIAAPIKLAAELAVANSAQAAGVVGSQIVLDPQDDGGGEFGEDQATGVARAFVGDKSVVAITGPLDSEVAKLQLPITNGAGLLQCSPSATDATLTKPNAGALDLRSAFPNRINFVRLPAAADVEGRAVASFAFHDLGSQAALVIDNALPIGRSVADNFQSEFEALGGSAVRRALNPGADPAEVLDALDASVGAPNVVFFGGFTNDGAAAVRQAMADGGHGDIPFLGWDGLWDGSGEVAESFIALAGRAAVGSYVSRPSVGTVNNEFDLAYRNTYGEPPGSPLFEYAAASHACVEIIMQSVAAVLPSASTPEALREAVRADAVDPANRFRTVLGDVSFDRNGDSQQQFVTFYRVDPTAASGTGDWVVMKQQNFGPAQ